MKYHQHLKKDDESASKITSGAGEGPILAIKKSTTPKIIQESEKFVEWAQHDSALMTSLDASMTLTYENKAILDGLPDEYDGYVTSVMSRMTTFTIPEAESFLFAYEDRINKKNKPPPMAHLTQANNSANSDQTYGRGGRNGRGAGRGHTIHTCYHRFDPSYQYQTQPQQPNVPYANSYPPPPPTSFHQPKAYLTAPSTTSETNWLSRILYCRARLREESIALRT
ncbi:hypothetical protein PIB30_031628 [Stylosanthes scabra]|uniref:Uncharacterized protein n=1 Tax=Stylosanthes scabra TaxID=79078 RepID=A0ABU6WE09_9FABA|nr:hypothetical protein [Stylosanthes scabra]